MKSWKEKFKSYVLEKYPEEACGILVCGQLYDENIFIPSNNIHDDPKNHFEISKGDILMYAHCMVGVCHSHTDENYYISEHDMVMQKSSGVPWYVSYTDGYKYVGPIIFGDKVIHTNYLGLEFIHGAQDCYTLIRDWYYNEKNILLPSFSREFQWWKPKPSEVFEKATAVGGSGLGKDLYLDNMNAASFYEVDKTGEIERGDVILMSIGRTYTSNHASIYLEGGRIVHHLEGQLSCTTSYGAYIDRIDRVFRFKCDTEHAESFKEAAKGVILV